MINVAQPHMASARIMSDSTTSPLLPGDLVLPASDNQSIESTQRLVTLFENVDKFPRTKVSFSIIGAIGGGIFEAVLRALT